MNSKTYSLCISLLLIVQLFLNTISADLSKSGNWKYLEYDVKRYNDSIHWYFRGRVGESRNCIHIFWWKLCYPEGFSFVYRDNIKFGTFKNPVVKTKLCVFAKNCEVYVCVYFTTKAFGRIWTFKIVDLETSYYDCLTINGSWLFARGCNIIIYVRGSTTNGCDVIVSVSLYFQFKYGGINLDNTYYTKTERIWHK